MDPPLRPVLGSDEERGVPARKIRARGGDDGPADPAGVEEHLVRRPEAVAGGARTASPGPGGPGEGQCGERDERP